MSLHAIGRHGSVDDVRLIIPRLDPTLESSGYVRWQAATALQKIYNPELAPTALVAAMRNDVEPDVRQAAAKALGQYADPGVFESLVAVLQDDKETNYGVINAARTSLSLLTGEDFGNDASLWTQWANARRDKLFSNQQPYTFTPYQKPPGFLDQVQFWKDQKQAEPKAPTGFGAASEVEASDANKSDESL